MAYITFLVNREAISVMNRRTVISVDGGKSFPALGNLFEYFKIDRGDHSVIVTSENGQSWECADYVGNSDVMNIKLTVGDDGNVVSVGFNIGPEPSGMMFMKKKKLP